MKTILLVSCLLLSLTLKGQSNFMSLSFGACQPLGEYGEMESLSSDGFAVRGFAMEYSGVYYFTNYFGLSGNIQFLSNIINQNKVKDLLKNEIPDNIPDDVSATTELGYWRNVGLLVGPYFTLGNDKIALDVFGQIGFGFVMPPEITVHAQQGEDYYSRSMSSQNVSFSGNLGLSLRYNINDNYGIRVHTGYYQSYAKGDIREEINDVLNPGNSGETTEEYSTQVKLITVGIGIIYRL